MLEKTWDWRAGTFLLSLATVGTSQPSAFNENTT
jgi:hypothetical protein